MNNSNRKLRTRELVLLLLPVLIIVVFGIFVKNRPVKPSDSQVKAKIEKVTLTRFVAPSFVAKSIRKQDFLKISVVVGYEGAKPTWWERLPATIGFEEIVVTTFNGRTIYKSSSVGPAIFDAKSGLFRRSCDIPLYAADGTAEDGTVKFFVRVNGGGYRPNDPNYERVGLSCRELVTVGVVTY